MTGSPENDGAFDGHFERRARTLSRRPGTEGATSMWPPAGLLALVQTDEGAEVSGAQRHRRFLTDFRVGFVDVAIFVSSPRDSAK